MSVTPQLPAKLPVLSAQETDNLKRLATAWAGLNGLVVMRPTGIQVAPCSLLPMPFPRRVYEQVRELMLDFNVLVHQVSLDYEFLNEHLAPVAQSDEFQDRLLKILNLVKEEGIRQPISLGVHRSDYMLHAAPSAPLVAKQVEINTVSSSFAGLSEKVTKLHRFLLQRAPIPGMQASDCPDNSPIEAIAEGLAEACRLYAAAEPAPTPASQPRNLGVLFIVQPNEGNIFDQAELEMRLWDRHGLPVVRATLEQIDADGKLDEGSRRFRLGGVEVAVAYFRAGYTPNDYPGEAQWRARLALERSAAVKCPTVAYQCVGAKKIQQVLARPGALERFAAPAAAARMRAVFAGLYPLGDGSPEAAAAKAAALADPAGFVLKPQREGGGNNLYDAEMKEALATQTDDQLRAYILMDIIRAPAARALFLREGAAADTQATTELGTYGVTLADDGPAAPPAAGPGAAAARLLVSRVAGHLLRSKAAGSKETGVAAGFGVLDSPLLYDE